MGLGEEGCADRGRSRRPRCCGRQRVRSAPRSPLSRGWEARQPDRGQGRFPRRRDRYARGGSAGSVRRRPGPSAWQYRQVDHVARCPQGLFRCEQEAGLGVGTMVKAHGSGARQGDRVAEGREADAAQRAAGCGRC